MKMNKIMAAGIAATLAVTSLSAVVSAADPKTFDMGWVTGFHNSTVETNAYVSAELGGDEKNPIKQEKIQVVSLYMPGLKWTNKATGDEVGSEWVDGGITIDVEGTKGTGNNAARSHETFTMKYSNGYAYIVVLDKATPIYHDGEFAPYYFDTITKITLKFNVKGKTTSQYVYDNEWKSGTWDLGNAYVTNYNPGTDGKINSISEATGTPVTATSGTLAATNSYIGSYNTDLTTFNGVKATDRAAGLVAYAFENGGYYVSEAAFKDPSYSYANKSTSTDYPVLVKTDADNNNVLDRYEVKVLSETDAYWSETANNNTNGTSFDVSDQTYRDNDMTKGTGPNQFAGLATQVGEYFNKQDNGTITFKFTAAQSSASNNWAIGGIPSTEVGLATYVAGASAKDFALFFNYGNTSGTMLTAEKVDLYSGEVTFDISKYLDDCAGLTKATLENIYYGLATGMSVQDGDAWVTGLKVESVTLAYEDSKAADTAADTAADEKEAEVKEEPKTDDKADEVEVEIPDDTEEPDDATVVIEEPDDTQTVVDNTQDNTVVVNPGTTAPAADENPHTGAALAVVPAALAAAAMLISKKRK